MIFSIALELLAYQVRVQSIITREALRRAQDEVRAQVQARDEVAKSPTKGSPAHRWDS